MLKNNKTIAAIEIYKKYGAPVIPQVIEKVKLMFQGINLILTLRISIFIKHYLKIH